MADYITLDGYQGAQKVRLSVHDRRGCPEAVSRCQHYFLDAVRVGLDAAEIAEDLDRLAATVREPGTRSRASAHGEGWVWLALW